MHAPHPWYTIEYRFGVVLHDLHGRRIAEVFHDQHDPQTSAATARLVKLAPCLLLDLKMTAEILRDDGRYPDLCAYIDRTVAATEFPPEKAVEILRLSA
jgi:hypothetical protein